MEVIDVIKYEGDNDYRSYAMKDMIDFDSHYKKTHSANIFNNELLETFTYKLETNKKQYFMDKHKEEFETLEDDIAKEKKKTNDNVKKLNDLTKEKKEITKQYESNISKIESEIDKLNKDIEKSKKLLMIRCNCLIMGEV